MLWSSRLSVLLASSALVSLAAYADSATAPGEQNPYRLLSTIVVTGSTDAVDESAVYFLGTEPDKHGTAFAICWGHQSWIYGVRGRWVS